MSYTVEGAPLNCPCCSDDDHTPPTCTTVTVGVPATVHVRIWSPLYEVQFDAPWDSGSDRWNQTFPDPVNLVLCQTDDPDAVFPEIRWDQFFVQPPMCGDIVSVAHWAAEFAHDGANWSASISGEGVSAESCHMGPLSPFTVLSLSPLHLVGGSDCVDCFGNGISMEITVPPPPMPFMASAPALRTQIDPTRTVTRRIRTRPARPCNCGKTMNAV